MSQFINFNTIIGNGKSYYVPLYQRDYSWNKEDWEDLWNDILEIPNDKSHYLGYLVLQPNKTGEDSYWIIDGQQRLITLSLLALAVKTLLLQWAKNNIEKDENTVRADKETERYLGNFSTSKLTISPKLTLNRNNDDFYKSWLLNIRQPVENKLKASDKLLYRAYTYFLEQLEKHFENNKSGAQLTEFLEKIVGNGIVFTQIIVEDDVDAFKVFETLNARGVKLSPADLLKNYIFKLVSQRGEIDLNEAERRWNNLNNILSSNDITNYIRHFWNSKYDLSRQAELFKKIKKNINDAETAFTVLHDLEKQGTLYNGFKTPFDTDLWSKDERPYLTVLDLLGVSTCYPLMLAFLENLPRLDFAILLREIAVLSLRYTIAQRNPNTAEIEYSKVANLIYRGQLSDVRSVIRALKPIYVEDDSFEAAFATAEVNTKRKKGLVKYLLIKLENQISQMDYQYEEASATIEHILPENPGSIWDSTFPPAIQEEYIYKIGNYTLLASSVNKKLDSETPFAEKLSAYQQSAYKLSNQYCDYDDFTPATLQVRQKKLAGIAKGVWKSAFIQ